MLCIKFGKMWPSGSRDELQNVKVYRKMDGWMDGWREGQTDGRTTGIRIALRIE